MAILPVIIRHLKVRGICCITTYGRRAGLQPEPYFRSDFDIQSGCNLKCGHIYWTPFGEDRPPSAIQLSAGWKNYAIPHLSLTIDVYCKQLYNPIDMQDLERYLDYHTDYQIGTGQSAGIEIMAQYNRKRLSSWLACTLSKTTRTFAGRTVPLRNNKPLLGVCILLFSLHAK